MLEGNKRSERRRKGRREGRGREGRREASIGDPKINNEMCL